MKKEFMKRVMAAGMVAAMALTTVACGGSADNSASTVSYTHLTLPTI